MIILLLFPMFLFGVINPPQRPIFDDMVTGDAFRAFSDHAYDEISTNFVPEQVAHGQTVFVRTDHLKQFFEQFHHQIPSRYILITHNADDPVPGPYKSYLDDPKIIAWFGENVETTHPKLIVIPMGCANFNWPNGNQDKLKKVKGQNLPKEHLLHMGFTIQNNYAERWPIFRQFSNASYCYRTTKKMYEGYLTDTAASHFELAPMGIALDTYRLWECLYIGTIPIVRTSSLDPLYANLPVLIIQDWKQVTDDFLNEKLQELGRQTYNLEKLSMQYWKNLILTYKSRL